MHKGVIILVKATSRNEAKDNAQEFLAGYENDVWDWYQIGGRWCGTLTGYDPRKDPANLKTCDLCNGTGMRNDQLGLDLRKQDPTYKCNGCSGKGKEVVWPTNFEGRNDDIMRCSDKHVQKVVRKWAKNWEAEQLKECEENEKQYAADKFMRGYTLKKKGAILDDDFTFDSNVYDTTNQTNKLPKSFKGLWAVMVDLHN